MRLQTGMSVNQLVKEMNATGVLGAGNIGKAANLVSEMFNDPDYTVFLTLAGAIVPAGFRRIIADLIDRELINVLVTTGSNMVHDMVEALGHRHSIGTFGDEDRRLKKEKIGRIGDIYIEQEAFQSLEKWLYQTVEAIPEEKRRRISAAELLNEVGKRIKDRE
mgnify:CR=1 FL=1